MSQYFRAGVGIAVVDDESRVLVLERHDISGAWQLPQGGLHRDEDPATAASRELWEETGLAWHQVDLLGEYPRWLVYELPPDNWSARTGRGQAQRWFVVKLVDPKARIDLGAIDPDKGEPEFATYRWMTFDELLRRTAPFRRVGYEQLALFVLSLVDRGGVDRADSSRR